jgi:hypothetical protein
MGVPYAGYQQAEDGDACTGHRPEQQDKTKRDEKKPVR